MAPEICPHWPDGNHAQITVYRRPWRRWFHREFFDICISCGAEIPKTARRDPDIRIMKPSQY